MGACASTHNRTDFHESYTVGAKLWQGEFAQVRMVKQPYAIDDYMVRIEDLRDRGPGSKSANRADKAHPSVLAANSQHAAIWRKIGQHDKCVTLKEVFLEDWLCFFVTDLAEHGFLYVIERINPFNEVILARFFKDALEGLQHVHKLGIVHGDVKPDNFMVRGPPYHLKLTGFGSAGLVASSGAYKGERRGVIGTAGFMSPEMLSTKRFDSKADIWSFGVMVYLLYYGAFPYRSEESVKSGYPAIDFKPWRISKKNTKLSDKAEAFVKAILNRYPLKRPSAEDVLKLELLSDVENLEAPVSEHGEKQTLLPILCGAIRAGAFGRVTEPEPDDVDHILNYYQYKHHGAITPWTRQTKLGSVLHAAMDKAKKGDDKMTPDISMIVGNMHQTRSGRRGEDGGNVAVQSVDVSSLLRDDPESPGRHLETASMDSTPMEAQRSMLSAAWSAAQNEGASGSGEALGEAMRHEGRLSTIESKMSARKSGRSSQGRGNRESRERLSSRELHIAGAVSARHASDSSLPMDAEGSSPRTPYIVMEGSSPRTPYIVMEGSSPRTPHIDFAKTGLVGPIVGSGRLGTDRSAAPSSVSVI